MSPVGVVLLVFIVAAVDGLILFVAVPRIVKAAWAPLAGRFPPVGPAPDAVRRNFQSFSIGLLNLGWSLHVAADEGHLHLYPALVPRWWGVTPVSVPWGAIRDRGPTLFGQQRARIGVTDVVGPRWCLGLAAGEAGG